MGSEGATDESYFEVLVIEMDSSVANGCGVQDSAMYGLYGHVRRFSDQQSVTKTYTFIEPCRIKPEFG